MQITRNMITRAENARACPAALHWLREAPRTIDELIDEKPSYAAWALCLEGFYELLSIAQFERLVRRSPGGVLLESGSKVSDKLLNEVALLVPGIALMHFARLTSAIFDACVMAAPASALSHANDQLTETQRATCAERAPNMALVHAALQLSNEVFALCVRVAPGVALSAPRACYRLTPRQFASCVKVNPRAALLSPAACRRLTPRQFAACVKAQPFAALVYARDRLTPKQEKACLAANSACS